MRLQHPDHAQQSHNHAPTPKKMMKKPPGVASSIAASTRPIAIHIHPVMASPAYEPALVSRRGADPGAVNSISVSPARPE